MQHKAKRQHICLLICINKLSIRAQHQNTKYTTRVSHISRSYIQYHYTSPTVLVKSAGTDGKMVTECRVSTYDVAGIQIWSACLPDLPESPAVRSRRATAAVTWWDHCKLSTCSSRSPDETTAGSLHPVHNTGSGGSGPQPCNIRAASVSVRCVRFSNWVTYAPTTDSDKCPPSTPSYRASLRPTARTSGVLGWHVWGSVAPHGVRDVRGVRVASCSDWRRHGETPDRAPSPPPSLGHNWRIARQRAAAATAPAPPSQLRRSTVTSGTRAEKFESFELINLIRETSTNFGSCNSCEQLVPSCLHEFMSQNLCLFHVSTLSVRYFRNFLLMYPGSICTKLDTEGKTKNATTQHRIRHVHGSQKESRWYRSRIRLDHRSTFAFCRQIHWDHISTFKIRREIRPDPRS